MIIAGGRTFSQNYSSNGSMSQEVLENFLDRAITMQTLVELDHSPYAPTPTEFNEDIDLIGNVGAKFVGRLAYWWGHTYSGSLGHEAYLQKASLAVSQIKSNDPDVICQAAIFENVGDLVNHIEIPDHVWNTYGYYGNNIPNGGKLKYIDMLYPGIKYHNRWGSGFSVPDISREATQIWFYYLAT